MAGSGYMPVLMGKEWELAVLSRLSPAARDDVLPLFEILPTPGEKKHPLSVLRDKLPGGMPPTSTVIVDDTAAPRARDPEHTLPRLAQECLQAGGPRLLPAVWLDSPADAFRRTREVVAVQRRGALLRVQVFRRLDTGQRGLCREVTSALRALALPPWEVVLLLDAGPVTDGRTRDGAVHALLHSLVPLFSFPWRGLFLASGAFPAPRSRETGVAREFRVAHRHDAQCWRSLAARFPTARMAFADYALAHPGIRPRSRPNPRIDPYLAYTVGDFWHIRSYERVLPGFDEFFTLSQDLLKSEDWRTCAPGTPPSSPTGPEDAERPADDERVISEAASVSWGDGELARCALGLRSTGRAGGPSQWRAWATSHHIETVCERLRRTGTP